ncbi:MAG: ATP-dependent RNA helicase HrpA [Pseudomonadales bacterium]|nr:ATP-dependent RNA helicase HrpA [Pseudomonadales bacterium]
MSNQLHQSLKSAIDRSMIKDRFRFTKDLHAKQQRARLARRVEESVQLAERRAAAVPDITFPEVLPVTQHLDELKRAIDKHQVVIVAGETGSGKTTQLPKLCLEMGRGVFGLIGHTQPRRVAARTVGARIADELGVTFGEQVGYQVRFTDKTRDDTLIKVMTDGILLAETQHDKFLEAYDTLIIDEAHERSLNIDFLLGYLKRILPKRPDLKVIVTSATIDVDRFSRHFGGAPVVEVSGRTYPVEVRYRPLAEGGDDDERQYRGVLDALEEIMALERGRGTPGDVLVFLSGEREIRELAHEIKKARLDNFDVLPLYSRLSVAEQNRVFQSHSRRRVVLATNVAETSLTVPGIRYVIDPGFARISRYSVRSKVQQLPIEPVSKASADQRKGRCGRVEPGVCFRLYTEEDFESRPDFTQPEILRTNLASVILQMLTLKLGDMSKFPFIERPEQRQINDGFQLLRELLAVDERRHVTKLGKEIARFPVDLRLARMILEAGKNGCLREVITIVSALATQDPRDRPHDAQQAADEKHRRFHDERSDFLAFVNLWEFYEKQRQDMTQNQLRKFCRENFLSYIRMREWRDNHRQLLLLCKETGMRLNREPSDYASVHRSLLSGLLGNIGERVQDNEYQGARNRRHFIFPGSSQFKKHPRWIVSAELVETSRLFARTVAAIESEWVEPLATHLVKRNFHEPFFDVKRGQVIAYEEVMLYGISIVKRRATDYGAVDPVRARNIFIQSALVEQQLESDAGFFRHNTSLVAEILDMESRTRKRDILVDNLAIYRFYDERLPSSVMSAMELEDWRRQAERKNPKLLYLDRDYLMRQDAALPETLYPSSLEVANTSLPLDYHFDPQHEDDGVSIVVPVAMLRQVDEARLDWVIPGLLREKCLALIRSLPKSVRKNFVPAPDYADRASASLEYDGRRLTEALADRLFRLSGVKVAATDFDEASLDRHLAMNIRVVDEKGGVLQRGRDLAALRREFAGKTDQAFRRGTRHAIETDGATDWQFGELPETVQVTHGGVSLTGYPGLVDKGDSVSVQVVDNAFDAARLSRLGLQRLVMLKLADARKYLVKQFPRFKEFALYYATWGTADELKQDVVEAVFRYTFIEGMPTVRSEAAFRERLAERQRLMSIAGEVGDLMVKVLSAVHRIRERLAEETSDLSGYAREDIEGQLSRLVGPGFVTRTPLRWLRQYPRYLAAIEYRLEKLRGNLAKDREQCAEVASFESRLLSVPDESRADLEEYRWMLEEYRVSLFAQAIGTSVPVSGKRLQRLWDTSMAGTGKAQRR